MVRESLSDQQVRRRSSVPRRGGQPDEVWLRRGHEVAFGFLHTTGNLEKSHHYRMVWVNVHAPIAKPNFNPSSLADLK